MLHNLDSDTSLRSTKAKDTTNVWRKSVLVNSGYHNILVVHVKDKHSPVLGFENGLSFLCHGSHLNLTTAGSLDLREWWSAIPISQVIGLENDQSWQTSNTFYLKPSRQLQNSLRERDSQVWSGYKRKKSHGNHHNLTKKNVSIKQRV
jgi:hypothetical protein